MVFLLQQYMIFFVVCMHEIFLHSISDFICEKKVRGFDMRKVFGSPMPFDFLMFYYFTLVFSA